MSQEAIDPLEWDRAFEMEPAEGGDRRRSPRVCPDTVLPVRIARAGRAWLVNVGLGGAALETEHRLEVGSRDKLLIEYRDSRAELEFEVRRSAIHELVYLADGRSHLRYRVRIAFRGSTVEALNLLYAIMKDFWTAADDEFTPLE
jgi:hypothetical protein